MALKPLKVQITGDTSGLDKALDTAGRNLKGLATAAAAGSVVVVGALAAMTASGLKQVDANTKLARSMDATVNGLRAVQQAAGYAGISTGEATAAFQQMNRELVRAAEKGTPAYDALRKIGMVAEDFAGLDVDERAALIADRMSAMGISAAQASDVLRDLGIRSRDMALLMLQGGDAIRSAREEVTAFGIELTETQTTAIEAANDAIARMSLVFEGLRNQLAASVAPALQSVADKFNTLAQSDATQAAISRIVDAFTNLANIILTEDFIGAATGALETLAGVAATVAEGMVWVSQNVEIVTAAFGTLAIAVAAAGGPLTIVAGLLAVALGGIAMWRSRAEDAAEGSDAAAEAQKRLNEALGVFYQTGAPSAGKAAVDLANDNYKLADSALAAAEAELAKRQAVLDAEAARVESINAATGDGDFLTTGTVVGAQVDVGGAQAAIDKARADLENARRLMDRTVRDVTGSSYGTVTIDPAELPEFGLPDDIEIPGLGGGGAVADQFAARLEALTNGLKTESEVVAEWYADGLGLLKQALAEGDLTEAEYREQRERLEQEHQDRLNAIRKAGAAGAFDTIVGTGKNILSAIGQTNDKAAAAAKVFGAFEATVNAYRAASQALADPSLPWYAKIAAAGSVLTAGIGFANSIKGMSSSSSGGSSSGSGNGATAAAAASSGARYYFDLTGNGGSVSNQTFMETLSSALQGEIDNGGQVIFNGA